MKPCTVGSCFIPVSTEDKSSASVNPFGVIAKLKPWLSASLSRLLKGLLYIFTTYLSASFRWYVRAFFCAVNSLKFALLNRRLAFRFDGGGQSNVDERSMITLAQGVWREGVEMSGVERESLDARIGTLVRKIPDKFP